MTSNSKRTINAWCGGTSFFAIELDDAGAAAYAELEHRLGLPPFIRDEMFDGTFVVCDSHTQEIASADTLTEALEQAVRAVKSRLIEVGEGRTWLLDEAGELAYRRVAEHLGTEPHIVSLVGHCALMVDGRVLASGRTPTLALINALSVMVDKLRVVELVDDSAVRAVCVPVNIEG